MNMETTTDLETIRKHPGRFTWGRAEAVHDVGRYSIVESVDRKTQEVSFHPYVDGRNTHVSASSLEGALVLAVARGSIENPNTADERGRCAALLLGVR
jgi:hypothetical protein